MGIGGNQYSFPILRPSELVSTLSEVLSSSNITSIAVTPEALANPKHEFVEPIYRYFINELAFVDEASLTVPRFGVNLDHQEIYSTALPTANLLFHLMRFMKNVGVLDFNMRDVFYPNKSRTKRNFSAIINFIRFREGKINTYEVFRDENDMLRDKQEEAQQLNQELGQRVNQQIETNKADEPEAKAILAETAQIEASIAELQKKQKSDQKTIKDLKKTSNELSAEIADSNVVLTETSADIEELKLQVVRSPERIKKTLSRMTHETAERKSQNHSEEHALRQTEIKVANLDKLRKKIVKRQKEMSECVVELSKIKTLTKEQKEVKARLEAAGDELDELQQSEKRLTKKCTKVQAKIQSQEQEYQSKMASTQHSIAQVQQQKQKAERGLAKDRVQTDANQALINQIHQQLKDAEEEHEREMLKLRTEFQSLQQQVHTYHERLLHAMQNP